MEWNRFSGSISSFSNITLKKKIISISLIFFLAILILLANFRILDKKNSTEDKKELKTFSVDITSPDSKYLIPLSSPNTNLSKNAKYSTETTDKVWELTVKYDREKKQISLDKVLVVNTNYTADYRDSIFSPYELRVLNNQGEVLYLNKVNISEEIIYDPESVAGLDKNPIVPANIVTSIVPAVFKEGGDIIEILKNDEVVLSVQLPKEISFNLFSKIVSSAQAQQSGCGINIAFLQDGYSNIGSFRNDAQRIINYVNSLAPFAGRNLLVADIKENPDIGCGSDYIACMRDGNITARASQYGGYGKVVVLVNRSPTGGALAITSGMGGNLVLTPSSAAHGSFLAIAAHEFGHMIGGLYDRYYRGGGFYLQGSNKSNCTDNPNGETGWRDRGDNGYINIKGCSRPEYFAPSAPNCGVEGTSASLMSTVGCPAGGFEDVERNWMINYAIGNRSCTGGGSADPGAGGGSTPPPPPPDWRNDDPVIPPDPNDPPISPNSNNGPLMGTTGTTGGNAQIQTYKCSLAPSTSTGNNNQLQMRSLNCDPQ